MSSAKTIADILAFAELIDANSFIGSPWSSQCIYIAACAFLMESAYYSLPSSRSESPPPAQSSTRRSADFTIPPMEAAAPERNSNAKHGLLAAAAKENYQRCYKALKTLEAYWAGVKYILTVLDQKAKGIWDPQLYTAEEMDSTVEESPIIGSIFGPPGWKLTQPSTALDSAPPSGLKYELEHSHRAENAESGEAASSIDPTQGKTGIRTWPCVCG